MTRSHGRFPTPPRRIIILRALQLGDLLCAVPALRALRAAFPSAEAVLVGLPWARAFVRRYAAYLDGFREFPGFPGLPERVPDVPGIPVFLAGIQCEAFDLALQLHGSGPFVNPLTLLFGARRAAWFYLPGDYCPDPQWFMPWPDHGLETRRLLGLMEFLGIPAHGEELEFPIGEEDRRFLARLAPFTECSSADCVCVHPGASVPQRRWPAKQFAAVADALAARGLRVVLTGSAGELKLTRQVQQAMRHPALDLAGCTDLGAVAALLEGARLLVCNDTGVSHLAAALGTPSVVISTGDNPGRWAPADGRRHRVLNRDAGAEPRDVLRHADELLQGGADVPSWATSPSMKGTEPCDRCVS